MDFILKIFNVIFKSAAGEKKLGNFIYKMYKVNKDFQKKIGKVRSIYALYMNPNHWFTLLKNMPKDARQRLFKELSKMEKETHEEQVFRTDKEAFNKKMKEMNDELKGDSKWVSLSSSWIKRGKFVLLKSDKQLGNLMIQTKTSPVIYTYPMVTYDVWVLMKEANGFNGGGAGTIFWQYYLHDWMKSNIRTKVLSDLKMRKITREDADQVFYEQITRSEKRFYGAKNNLYRNEEGPLSKAYYEKQGGKGFKPGRRKTYRELYRQTNQVMQYKQVTTRWRKYGELGNKVAKGRQIQRKINKKERLYKNISNPLKWGQKSAIKGIRRSIKNGGNANE